MKVYCGNFNGDKEALVAAKSKAEAVRLLGWPITMGYFNKFYSVTGSVTDTTTALAAPGTVFLRRNCWSDGNNWKPRA